MGSKGIKEVDSRTTGPFTALPADHSPTDHAGTLGFTALEVQVTNCTPTPTATKAPELFTNEEPTVGLAGEKALRIVLPRPRRRTKTPWPAGLPQPDENGDLDPGELPGTLPGYLINLKAEFAVDEDIVVVNPDVEVTMGSGLISEMGYWQPGRGWDTSENNPVSPR